MDIIGMEPREAGFQHIYKRYAADVYRFSYWLCGNADDAKDITSETFVRIWTSESETRLETVKAYLFTIARNLYLHQQRNKHRHVSLTEQIADTTPLSEGNPDACAELERAMAAIRTLPEAERTVLLLRVQGELSYEEIATVTGLPISTVKITLFRARKKLYRITAQD
jgi:RNA polymerase sigma-70 factor, ECF subfamily